MFGFLVSRMLPIIPKSVVRRVASRYVAGEDLATALVSIDKLKAAGYRFTLDVLGEDAITAQHADSAVEDYLKTIEGIAEHKLPATVSVKLTHIGLRLGRIDCEARLTRIIEGAKAIGSSVCIDMEDSGLTEVTHEIFQNMRARHGNVTSVIQAYLRRTEADARRLAAVGTDLRLCKGIYTEPKEIAFKKREEIRESYLRTAEVLLTGEKCFVGLATHDRPLVERLQALISRLGIPDDRYEFQALLGVPVEDMLQELMAQGHPVRLYVPFGPEWYPYSTRRLKENPKIASYVVKNWFSCSGGNRT